MLEVRSLSALQYLVSQLIARLYASNPFKPRIAKRARQWYENSIRQRVEIEKNIGKMVLIDVESGDYEVDDNGLKAAHKLSEKHPNARLFGIRIGYNVAVSFGGIMERV